MKFENFFDAYNKTHVKAYHHLAKTGTWPVDFLPAHVILSHLDVMIAQSKLANAWVLAVEDHYDGKVKELLNEI